MLVFADRVAREALAKARTIDRAASLQLAEDLFPGESLEFQEDCDLYEIYPDDDELIVGCFDGVSVIAAREFGIDYPSTLPREYREGRPGRTVYLHAMHSVVDWYAFAVWRDGELLRSLSLSPDSGILEDIGKRLPFEAPFWEGKYPAVDGDEDDGAYPFPFHPLEMGDAALEALFGFQLEGHRGGGEHNLFEPDSITLARYKRTPKERPPQNYVSQARKAAVFRQRGERRWWQFWK